MRTQTIPKPHPGEILLEEFIKPAAIPPHRVAKDSGISQPTMNQIVNGKRPISTVTALRTLGEAAEKLRPADRRARSIATHSSRSEAVAVGRGARPDSGPKQYNTS